MHLLTDKEGIIYGSIATAKATAVPAHAQHVPTVEDYERLEAAYRELRAVCLDYHAVETEPQDRRFAYNVIFHHIFHDVAGVFKD